MKKGFTLIELLAVIVILAIIALIATPIVLNIISDTKESATLRSAEMYLDAVEQAIMRENMNASASFNPNFCEIAENGDLLCDESIEVMVEVDGEKPEGGTITILAGKIEKVKLEYSDNKEIVLNENNKLVLIDSEYKIGQQITFNPGDQNRTWNIIDIDEETVTLMLTQNLGNTIAWYDHRNHNHSAESINNYGPKDVLEYLNGLTINWDNVDPIESYSYINNLGGNKTYGYREIKITDGEITIVDKEGNEIKDVDGESKARLITREEIFEIAQKENPNLTEKNLRGFIQESLGPVNTLLQSQGIPLELTSVDQGIEFAVQNNTWLGSESKYFQTYFTVKGTMEQYKINTTYNIEIPEFLYQNLYLNSNPYGYWTLSAFASESYDAWGVVYNDGVIENSELLGELGEVSLNNYSDFGVRPVIIIPKTKLSK